MPGAAARGPLAARIARCRTLCAADAHPDAVHDDLWFDAVDVGAADGLERALDLPQARGRVAPVDGPVGLTVL